MIILHTLLVLYHSEFCHSSEAYMCSQIHILLNWYWNWNEDEGTDVGIITGVKKYGRFMTSLNLSWFDLFRALLVWFGKGATGWNVIFVVYQQPPTSTTWPKSKWLVKMLRTSQDPPELVKFVGISNIENCSIAKLSNLTGPDKQIGIHPDKIGWQLVNLCQLECTDQANIGKSDL